MNTSNSMLTLSQIMSRLAEKGIEKEFRMNKNGEIKLQDQEYCYQPDDLKIIRAYRFEGDTNPDDNAALYVIEDMRGNKGILIEAYGAESNYSGDCFDEFLRKITVDERDEYRFE